MVPLPDNRFPTINPPRRTYTKCPMCQGRGYCEQQYNNHMAFDNKMPTLPQRNESPILSNGHFRNQRQIRRSTITDTGEPLKLPVLVKQRHPPNARRVRQPEQPVKREETSQQEFMNANNQSKTHSSVFGKLVLPSIESRDNTNTSNISDRHRTSVKEEFTPGVQKDLLPQPKEIDNPQEAMKIAISNLKQTEWQIVLQAIHDIVQVSRYNPALVEPHMPVINRALCQLLHSLRSRVARTACQAARELFRTMQCTKKPEFDEVVSCLLKRTADMNRFIREDSNEALESMVMYIPIYHAVRALVTKGSSHKNPLVRAAASRLLTCVVIISGAETILSPTANKDVQWLVLSTSANFLTDGNLEARMYAKKMIRFLMEHEDFDSVFYSEIDRSIIEKIEKTLGSLRGKDDATTEIKEQPSRKRIKKLC